MRITRTDFAPELGVAGQREGSFLRQREEGVWVAFLGRQISMFSSLPACPFYLQ